MTREEAIKWLKRFELAFPLPIEDYIDAKEALDMAIKALEQQPSEDCISRKATIDAIYKKHVGGKDVVDNAPINDLYACGLEEAVDAVENMPPVTPKQQSVTDFADKCKECGKILNDKLQTRWIPCSEKMPKELEPVNITWINHNPESYYADIKDKTFTSTGVYFNGQWYWWSTICTDILAEYSHNYDDIIDDDVEITAWMPLPEPYKAESEEENE